MTLAPENATATKVPLRWSDMDAYGHVNNVQFLRLLEDARILAFADWFGRANSVVGRGVLVARNEIEYLAPLVFRPEPIEIAMWVTTLGGASYDVGYEVRDGEAGSRSYALAETTLVAYDFDAARPRRLPAEDRAILETLRGEAVPFRRRSSGDRR